MRISDIGRSILAASGSALLAGTLLLTGAVGVHAQLATCRTDPTITLSNGYTATLWADISTDISHVNAVSYVLHVPKGVTLKSISYDANGSVEQVSIVADQSGSHYEDLTTVDTSNSGVAYSAYATRMDSTVASKGGKSDGSVTLNWCT
jgi:hypothetical protein